MPGKAVYDTRFFIDLFYSTNQSTLTQLKEELRINPRRLVSVVTIYETHRLNQRREGKTVATLRSETIQRDFTVIPLDYAISVHAAQIGEQYRTPLADSVIAATALRPALPLLEEWMDYLWEIGRDHNLINLQPPLSKQFRHILPQSAPFTKI